MYGRSDGVVQEGTCADDTEAVLDLLNVYAHLCCHFGTKIIQFELAGDCSFTYLCRNKIPIMSSRPTRRPSGDRFDFILQLWFFILAIACIVCFFLYRHTQPGLFQRLGFAAILLRIIYYVKQMIQRRRDKQ